MDKDLSKKDAEEASSDEEEAFESADEGEESAKTRAKSSEALLATSAGIESANSTSKELVGTSDRSYKTPVTSGDNVISETAELENRTPSMDEKVTQKEEDTETLREDIPSIDLESSPCSDESETNTELKNKTLVEEVTNNASPEVSGHETKHAVSEGGDDKIGKSAEAGNDSYSGQDKSTANETKLGAEENTTTTDSEGQNEASGNLDKEPQKDSGESSCDEKVEDLRPDSSSQEPAQAQETSSSSGGWGWGSWTSVLSQATASVTSGLSSVIETVETSLGVPDPEEMARKVKEEEKAVKAKMSEERRQEASDESKSESASESTNEAASESFFSAFGVSSLTSVVQSTGKELVSGGLDALEFLGKKTMDVLAEGDPGLRQKREKITGKGPSLSQMLREAKEESEQKAAATEGGAEGTPPTVDLLSEFDKFQGLAHLEALEMLSRDSEAKLESRIIDLAEEELAAVKPLLRAVEEVFHIDDNEADDDMAEGEDFKTEITENVKSLNLSVTADKILTSQERARDWITACVKEQDNLPGSKEGMDIYTTAVSSMAELTARTVELFHKFTELLLHQTEQPAQTSSLVRAQCVRKMTDAVLEEISVLATHFAGCLNTAADDSDNPDSVSSLITSLYLDSSTSADYLRNSLKLLRPVLQLSSLDEKNVS